MEDCNYDLVQKLACEEQGWAEDVNFVDKCTGKSLQCLKTVFLKVLLEGISIFLLQQYI